jgi:hypothetical protein
VESVRGVESVKSAQGSSQDDEFNQQVTHALRVETGRVPASETEIATSQEVVPVLDLKKKDNAIDLAKIKLTASLVETLRSWGESPMIDSKMREAFQAREVVGLSLAGEATEGYSLDDPFLILDIGDLQTDGSELTGVIQGVLQIPSGAQTAGTGPGFVNIPFGGLLRIMPGQQFLFPIEISKMTPEQLLAAKAILHSAPSAVGRGLADLLESPTFLNGETQLFLLLNLPEHRESN